MGQELDDMFKGLERSTRGNRFIEFKAQGGDVPDPSEPLDMIIVASPCHKWEPVKIPEDHVGIVHCLICGEAFAI